MILENLLKRTFFCLPFIIITIYLHSYHGEWINNAQVEWQYLKDDNGTIYLAMDVYSPSGIKIDSILSDGRDITDSWQLLNYPDWYKGKEHFKKLGEFQEVLHPYLPYNKDFNVLYTNGWYTFLYQGIPERLTYYPFESTISIKYQNLGTRNYYNAKYVSGIKIASKTIKSTVNGPVIDFQLLYPLSFYKYSYDNKPRINLDNLVVSHDFSGYVLKDLGRNDYGIYVQDDEGAIIDSLKSFVCWNAKGAYQVYSKDHESNVYKGSRWGIDFVELFGHIVAILFMVYFVLICRYVGLAFVKWRGIVLDSYAEKLVIAIFLGIIFLTYLFFVIGILKLLYFPIVFAILSLILFFGFRHRDITELKAVLGKELSNIKKSPWRGVFLIIFLGILFYNLSYCFVPATYIDGSGDIENSYLPILNDYLISHSFAAPIYNSTNGIAPQAIDVLRTIAKMFIGEPGVYLLSFLYLLLILGGVYLTGKKIFKIKSMLIYLTVLLFFPLDIFAPIIHFGKLHVAMLSFLLISLYSVCYSDCGKNYIISALFFAFLSSQCPQFVLIALIYYLSIFTCSYYKHKKIKNPVFRLHLKSLAVFCLLSSIFPLKLIFEVGICFPPGIIPAWLSDTFLKFNHNNELYKYIDNNYIRHFYILHGLSVEGSRALHQASLKDKIFAIYDNLTFGFIFLFLPLSLKKGKCKIIYFWVTISVVLVAFAIDPFNTRMGIYYIYPLFILQFAIINYLILKLGRLIPKIIQFVTNITFGAYLKSLLKYRKLRVFFILRKDIVSKILVIIILFFVIFDTSHSNGITIKKLDLIKKMGALRVDYKSTSERAIYIWHTEALPIFLGKTKYQYLRTVPKDHTMFETAEGGAERYFDHAMLIRQYTEPADTILIVPVRFHSHTMRHITARHALGSVIYQKDISKIMADLKRLNINYLSTIPIHYKDYNPFYTPIFEEGLFCKYFKLLFSDNGSRFYKIIHDGSNTEYTPSPYDVSGLPFVPMLRKNQT